MRYGPKESPKKVLKRRRHGRWIARLLKCLGWTLRYRLEDPHHVLDAGSKSRIWVVWHNRLASTPMWYARLIKPIGELHALVSASGDGEILATILNQFEMKAVRGSTSRGGVEALRQLLKQLQNGKSVVMTPDGPRGPCYNLDEGVIKLAQWSGVELVPIDYTLSHQIELKTWDRMRLPLPFAKSVMIIQKPLKVNERDDIEAIKRKLIERLGK